MLTDDDVLTLDRHRRAREVGRQIGWDLQFVVAGNPEFVGLVAGGGAEMSSSSSPTASRASEVVRSRSDRSVALDGVQPVGGFEQLVRGR